MSAGIHLVGTAPAPTHSTVFELLRASGEAFIEADSMVTDPEPLVSGADSLLRELKRIGGRDEWAIGMATMALETAFKDGSLPGASLALTLQGWLESRKLRSEVVALLLLAESYLELQADSLMRRVFQVKRVEEGEAQPL